MNDYPTVEELMTIGKWKITEEESIHALMEYIRVRWNYADAGYFTRSGKKRKGRIYRLSTGGWSGNEDIIEAMMKNYLFWSLCWQQSRCGGHYIFKVRKIGVKNEKNQKT